MDVPQKKGSSQATPDEQSQERRVHYVRSFRRTLGVAAMYGLDHSVALAQVEESYQELSRVLRLGGRLDLAVVDDSMIVNGHPAAPNDPHLQELAKTLNRMKLSDIGFRPGMTRREYGEMLEVFTRSINGGAAQDMSGADLLRRKRLKHVQLQGGTYQRVADDQVIVDKRQGIAPSRHPGRSSAQPSTTRRHDFEEWEREWKHQMEQGWNLDLETDSVSTPGTSFARTASSHEAIDLETDIRTAPTLNAPAPGTPATVHDSGTRSPSPAAGFVSAPEPPRARTPAPAPQPAQAGSDGTPDGVTDPASREDAQRVQALLAYLGGSDEAAGAEPSKMFEGFHLDARQLGDLVLRAAVAELGTGSRGGEPFTEIVVTCLNRAVAGLKRAPDGDTQKGRKEVMRAVAALEEVVMAKLATLSIPDEERKAVASSAKTAKNQLRLEGLAAEYARRRRALDQSERRILRMLRAKDVEDAQKTELRDLLAEAGMTPEGWDALVSRTQRTRPRKVDAEAIDKAGPTNDADSAC